MDSFREQRATEGGDLAGTQVRIENPFYYTYITERVKDPREYFNYFSPEILQEGVFKISQPMNHFILAAQGFGKTMFLRFFHYKNQSYIYNNEHLFNFYRALYGKKLPAKFAGIYYTISLGPYTQFARKDVSEEMWGEIYGNYLNLVLLEEITRLLFYCSLDPNRKWAAEVGIDSTNPQDIMKAVINLIESGYLPRRLLSKKKVENVSHFCEVILDEINWYHRLVSKVRVRDNDFPNYLIEPGRLPVIFVDSLRDSGVLSKDIRLFILLDEYQELSKLTSNGELPRVINSAIKVISRSPSSLLEFKIGTRRYGIKELRILGSETKIEREREYDIIDLEGVFSGMGGLQFYRRFIQDITKRRLEKNSYFKKRNFYDWFDRSSPKWEFRNLVGDDSEFKILKETLRLKTLYTFESLREMYKELMGGFPKDPSDQVIAGLLLLKGLTEKKKGHELVEFLKDQKTEKGWRKQGREIVFFTLAAIYGRQKRNFGHDSIVRASFPVVLNYLRLCKTMIELSMALLEEGRRNIPIQNQDRVFRLVSEDVFNEIASEKSSAGMSLQVILTRIGSLFRMMHKFVIPADLVNSFQVPTEEYEEFRRSGLFQEMMDHSLLRRVDYRIRGQKVTRFYVNKILAPYLDIPVYFDDAKVLDFRGGDLSKLVVTSKGEWERFEKGIVEEVLESRLRGRQLELKFRK